MRLVRECGCWRWIWASPISSVLAVTGPGASTATRLSVGLPGVPGHGASFFPAISSDGRYVAFATFGSNLVPNDTNGSGDYVVLHRQTGQISLVSVASSGAQGNGDSTLTSERPVISAGGHLVAFASAATNLVPNDTNGDQGQIDIFVCDRQAGTTTRVAVRSNGSHVGGPARNAAIDAQKELYTGPAMGQWQPQRVLLRGATERGPGL